MNGVEEFSQPRLPSPAAQPAAPRSLLLDECKRFVRTQPTGALSLLFILLMTLTALLSPVLAPYEPDAQYRESIMVGPNADFWMGTDDLGRDVFSRILHGARISLYVGLVTVVLSLIFGTLLGVVSGYFGGVVDMVIQRIMDGIMAVPALILALFIVALLGPDTKHVILALVVVETPRFARIVRGEMLKIRETTYVEAAKAMGARAWRIMLRHGVPNMVAPLTVLASLAFGGAIIAEASLSFLGIGTPPPNPSWGLMLSGATRYMENAPWLVVFPGLALSLSVLAFNLLGDALRDYFDPRLPS